MGKKKGEAVKKEAVRDAGLPITPEDLTVIFGALEKRCSVDVITPVVMVGCSVPTEQGRLLFRICRNVKKRKFAFRCRSIHSGSVGATIRLSQHTVLDLSLTGVILLEDSLTLRAGWSDEVARHAAFKAGRAELLVRSTGQTGHAWMFSVMIASSRDASIRKNRPRQKMSAPKPGAHIKKSA